MHICHKVYTLSMIIGLHVAIALLGIVCTTYGYFKPSRMTLRASYALVVLTFVSGFYLVWSEPAKILHMCLSGLGYLAVVMTAIVATRRKLISMQVEKS